MLLYAKWNYRAEEEVVVVDGSIKQRVRGLMDLRISRRKAIKRDVIVAA